VLLPYALESNITQATLVHLFVVMSDILFEQMDDLKIYVNCVEGDAVVSVFSGWSREISRSTCSTRLLSHTRMLQHTL
jgi:hypothetical protein